jgi:hypothetical protein
MSKNSLAVHGQRNAYFDAAATAHALGLARAVLESIPIVKFGKSSNKEAGAAAYKDIELADTGRSNRSQAATTDANNPSSRILPFAKNGKPQPR